MVHIIRSSPYGSMPELDILKKYLFNAIRPPLYRDGSIAAIIGLIRNPFRRRPIIADIESMWSGFIPKACETWKPMGDSQVCEDTIDFRNCVPFMNPLARMGFTETGKNQCIMFILMMLKLGHEYFRDQYPIWSDTSNQIELLELSDSLSLIDKINLIDRSEICSQFNLAQLFKLVLDKTVAACEKTILAPTIVFFTIGNYKDHVIEGRFHDMADVLDEYCKKGMKPKLVFWNILHKRSCDIRVSNIDGLELICIDGLTPKLVNAFMSSPLLSLSGNFNTTIKDCFGEGEGEGGDMLVEGDTSDDSDDDLAEKDCFEESFDELMSRLRCEKQFKPYGGCICLYFGRRESTYDSNSYNYFEFIYQRTKCRFTTMCKCVQINPFPVLVSYGQYLCSHSETQNQIPGF